VVREERGPGHVNIAGCIHGQPENAFSAEVIEKGLRPVGGDLPNLAEGVEADIDVASLVDGDALRELAQ
jgi:hypothetical protein